MLPIVLFGAGTATVTISQVIVTGKAFTVSDLKLPLTLAPGQNSAFTVTFAPTTAGSAVGSVSIVSNAVSSPSTVSLSGAGGHEVDLAWNASSSVTTGYNVYRGSKPSGPYTKLNSSLVTSTTYTDTTVQAGLIYYYVTTAVDAQGLESAYSNEAEATVPSDRSLAASGKAMPHVGSLLVGVFLIGLLLLAGHEFLAARREASQALALDRANPVPGIQPA